jgi:5-methylcytosine-specific restriction endonuclease McrA
MPTTTERGYGYAHKQRRAALLPLAYGTPCPICQRIMQKGDALDLDHSVPLAEGGRRGDRIVCARCNRSEGGKLGAQRRGRWQAPRNDFPRSRDW